MADKLTPSRDAIQIPVLRQVPENRRIRPIAARPRVPINFRISEFSLTAVPKQEYCDFVPFLPKGRLAIVTDAERDAVDVDAPLTNGAKADGEVVWS